MDQVARGWLIYELTDSAFQLGLVRGIQAIPILLLSPLAGSTADRYSRKMQVLVAQIVDGLLYGVVALLIFTGQIQPWHVYVTAFGMAIVWTFHQPSRAAMVGDAVPLNQLTNAVGLSSIVFNVARSAGPALAGFLIALCGTAAPPVRIPLRRFFTSWRQFGPYSCVPAGSHPCVLTVTRLTRPRWARASSKGGSSAGKTRRFAQASLS
jgi:MFS family permease